MGWMSPFNKREPITLLFYCIFLHLYNPFWFYGSTWNETSFWCPAVDRPLNEISLRQNCQFGLFYEHGLEEHHAISSNIDKSSISSYVRVPDPILSCWKKAIFLLHSKERVINGKCSDVNSYWDMLFAPLREANLTMKNLFLHLISLWSLSCLCNCLLRLLMSRWPVTETTVLYNTS